MIDDRAIPDELLPGCTARIEIGGSHEGSCFFVARGLAVTCFHVIEPTHLSSGDPAHDVALVDLTGGRYEVEEIPFVSDEVDLAVLRVKGAPGQACVLLDGGFRSQDRIYTYGYSDRVPDGAGTILQAESWVGNDEVQLKLSYGQVRPGMSGSPVLNERTGAVCGILKRTRNGDQPLGGYAISVKELFRRYPKLQTKNRRYHQENARWLDLLPSDVRRALTNPVRIRDRVVTARRIVIGVRQDEDGWWVDAAIYPEGDELEPVPVDLNAVRKDVARLFRDWALRGRVKVADQVRLLGGILSSAILPGEIGECFESLLADANRQNRLLVALRFNDETDRDLVYLPWEHLHVRRGEGKDVFFAHDPKLAFVRTAAAEPEEDLEGRAAASVLIVVTPPVDNVDLEREERVLMHSIATVAEKTSKVIDASNGLQVTSLSAPSPFELRDAVEQGEFDVVHYVGFGRFGSDNGGDTLALGDGKGGLTFISGGTLVTCLAQGKVRLVVLQPCLGNGGAAVPPDCSLLAPHLIENGIPAVVACQYPMPEDRAMDFNSTLYQRLEGGETIALAVQEARDRVSMGETDARAFVSPALFVRQPGAIALVDATRQPNQTRNSVVGANA